MASQQRKYETGYQALGSYYEDEHEDAPPSENIIHAVPDRNKSRWNHIENLDEFFTRVYQFHQRKGFGCMVYEDIMQIAQFVFIVLFTTYITNCVNYTMLFHEKLMNETAKLHISDVVYPLDQCVASFHWFIMLCLLLAALFLALRFIKLVYHICQYMEIREFYRHALKIPVEDISNLTWHEVQRRLLEVQKEEQMCVHKQDLTELDIYHRILRFKNYMIAMVNKSLLGVTLTVPFLGQYSFMTTGLKYNLEMILFWGPFAPFENNWHLKSDYKNYHKRQELADQLSSRIFWVGVGNLCMSPIIFLWQFLYSFFRYAEAVKRSPGMLGSRRWSLYGRLYLRHFNELDHEMTARLNRAYRSSDRYMNSFVSPPLTITAKFGAFFSGAMLAVLVCLALWDEDVFQVAHVLTIIAVLGATLTVCSSLIPDEHLVWCPELLMRSILAHIHYIPDSWKDNAHTTTVRDEFGILFQYKIVFVLEELLSPLITPYILIRKLRHKSLDIVDFYRNFTVEVTGVGDVCSFAQMDVRKHGNPEWAEVSQTEASQYHQMTDGKTELSLMHFTYTNPEWKPPQAGHAYLNSMKERAQQDALNMSMATTGIPFDNPLANSLHSLTSVGFGQFNSMISSMVQPSAQPTPSSVGPTSFPAGPNPMSFTNPTYAATAGPHASSSAGSGTNLHARFPVVRGAGLHETEGPLGGSSHGILSSVIQPGGTAASTMGLSQQRVSFAPNIAAPAPSSFPPQVDEKNLELLSNEMSLSALYMHDLHRQRVGTVPRPVVRGQYHDIPSSTRLPPVAFGSLGQAQGQGLFTESRPQMQPLVPRSDEEDDDDDAPPNVEFNFGAGSTPGGMLRELPLYSPRGGAIGGVLSPRQSSTPGTLAAQHRIPEEIAEEEGASGQGNSGEFSVETDKLTPPFS